MDKLINYIKASVAEMKKVTWPTRQETYNYTLLVIGVSLAGALFLGGLDYLFNLGFEALINR
jgi:preprotein translocase subunit SecE